MRWTMGVAMVLALWQGSKASAADFGDRAAFEFSNRCVRGYLPTSPTWTRYVDMEFSNGTLRIFPDELERWTCSDSDGGLHEAFRIPARVGVNEGDTWIILDMTPSRCRSNTDLYFVRPGQTEQAWRVVVSGQERGQLLYHEER